MVDAVVAAAYGMVASRQNPRAEMYCSLLVLWAAVDVSPQAAELELVVSRLCNHQRALPGVLDRARGVVELLEIGIKSRLESELLKASETAR